MDIETLKETLKRELPDLLQQDPDLRRYILDLTRQQHPDRAETEDRFYQMLAELRRDREEQTRKWEDQNRKWEDQNRKWEDQNHKWEDQNHKWEDQNHKWEDQNHKWDDFKTELQRDREEQARKWEDQNRKWEDFKTELQRDREEQARRWEANQTELRRLHEEMMAQARKHESSIGALGARWGLQSEKAFRDGLAAILEKTFGVQVLRVNEYDHSGEVFGRPDQIELDVIVRNGMLIICELKSSIDKAGMYIFERKARFYEKQHQRQADRLMVISPMIDGRAKQVAERLKIETYGYATEVEE